MKLAQVHHDWGLRVARIDGPDAVLVDDITTMRDLIDAGDDGIRAAAAADGDRIPLAGAQIGPPVWPLGRNIFCTGWNYRAHFAERADRERPEPEAPTFITKATTLAAPGAAIPLHAQHTSELDYEAELALVIGRTGQNIAEEDALDYIFGYCPANDLSGRDLQHRHGGQWFKGKSLNGICQLGPLLTTADDVPDPQQPHITCRLNGTVVQSASTAQMAFPVARLIADLSQGLTLLPGDIPHRHARRRRLRLARV